MSGAKSVFPKPLLDFGGQPEQAKHVCDGSPVLSDPACHFFLSHSEIGDKPLIRLGFFYWIQVFPLKVFDQGYF